MAEINNSVCRLESMQQPGGQSELHSLMLLWLKMSGAQNVTIVIIEVTMQGS